MDLGAMRAWMKRTGEPYLITERTYRTLVEEKETDVVEYRLVMIFGEMDYTVAVLEPVANMEADPAAAVKRLYDRIEWETHRDTRTHVDCERGKANGLRYLQEK